MTLLLLLLFLVAVLPPSLLQHDYKNKNLEGLSTSRKSVREEIVNKYNQPRRMVSPPGGDLLKMNKNLEDLSTTRKSVQEEIVNKYNQLRRMVSPPGGDLLKMQWSNDAQVSAQRWASQCTYEHSPQEVRITNIRCGENIFMASYPASWSRVIQNWYDEANYFSFGSGPNTTGAVVGHYTQIVSNLSYQVGCGVAACPHPFLKYKFVCHYCPLGKFVRRQYISYTLGEHCALCPDHCEDGLCTNICMYEDNYSNCAYLKALLTCEFPMIKEDCRATCNCESKIR